jgi:ribonuclease M5
MASPVIIVEGKSDTQRIHEVFGGQVLTIETGGSRASNELLEVIEKLSATREIIIFTDPDIQGEKIRKRVTEVVPQAKQAFLKRVDGTSKISDKSLGVEHANDFAIKQALSKSLQQIESVDYVDRDVLVELDLVDSPLAKSKREKLTEYLGIGYVNGKQLQKRLAMFGIDAAQLKEAVVNSKERSE